MKKIKCPCCGYFTIDDEDEVIVDICPVCFWQYDWIAQKYPDRVIGPNHVSLNDAIQNYRRFGACEEVSIPYVRLPYQDELALEEN